MKTYPYKVATIVLILIALSIVAVDVYQNKIDVVKIGSLTITAKDLTSFAKVIPSGKVIPICNINTRQCFGIVK